MADLIDRDRLLEYLHGEPVGIMLCEKYNLDGFIKGLKPAELPEPCEDTISRQAVIDLWEKYNPTIALDAMQYDAELRQLPPTQPEQKWIPVTENTLPDKNRVVVVCGEKGTWDYGTYRGHGDDIHFWHWKKNTYKRVYWWMYKEDAFTYPISPMPSNAK